MNQRGCRGAKALSKGTPMSMRSSTNGVCTRRPSPALVASAPSETLLTRSKARAGAGNAAPAGARAGRQRAERDVADPVEGAAGVEEPDAADHLEHRKANLLVEHQD